MPTEGLAPPPPKSAVKLRVQKQSSVPVPQDYCIAMLLMCTLQDDSLRLSGEHDLYHPLGPLHPDRDHMSRVAFCVDKFGIPSALSQAQVAVSHFTPGQAPYVLLVDLCMRVRR